MKQEYPILRFTIIFIIIVMSAFSFTYFKVKRLNINTLMQKITQINNKNIASSTAPITNLEEIEKKIEEEKPLATPEKVKGIYITGYTFSNKRRMKEIINLINRTELNSIVIDIKDPNGYYMFTPENEKLKKLPISKVALSNDDYKKLLKELQDNNIYTIARVLTFQDDRVAKLLPEVALKNKQGNTWKNWKGIRWLDITSEEAWKIPVLKAKEAINLGFDEIQFDYIRFPSDGNTRRIKYKNPPEEMKKFKTLHNFYKYLDKELTDSNIPISVDLFGLTYQTRNNPEYDLGIGQRLIDAALYFDYISPMVYPSHYPTGFLGYKNPAAAPYAIVNKAMSEGNKIMESMEHHKAKSRPWLQDFNLGAIYNSSMVRAQIKACDDNNTAGWILWNPRNVYTEGALKKQKNKTQNIQD